MKVFRVDEGMALKDLSASCAATKGLVVFMVRSAVKSERET